MIRLQEGLTVGIRPLPACTSWRWQNKLASGNPTSIVGWEGVPGWKRGGAGWSGPSTPDPNLHGGPHKITRTPHCPPCTLNWRKGTIIPFLWGASSTCPAPVGCRSSCLAIAAYKGANSTTWFFSQQDLTRCLSLVLFQLG